MKVCFEVFYQNNIATTAAICFQNWKDKTPSKEFIEKQTDIKSYQSGSFYKRELPCLLSLIN